jgi:hypothetical protein
VEELEAGIAEAQAQPGFEFLTPAVDGQWLHLAGAKEFAEQFGGMQGIPSPDADLQQKAVEAMRKAVDDSATVTSEGSDDIGDHLVANVDLRAFYGGITDALGTLTQGMPAGQLPPASEVPEADLKLDIWLADGTVKQVSFDLLQLSQLSEDVDIPEGVDELGILLQLDSFDDEVEVPGDAVEVDLQQIFQGLMQGMTGGVSGSSSEAVPAAGTDMTELCEQLKEAPDDVKKQFAEQCPDLAP